MAGRGISARRLRRAGLATTLVTLLLVALALPACSGLRSRGGLERGIASWYGPGFHHRRTANGEIFDQDALTAAHQTLPFDSVVEVHNLDNGKAVRVRINDRGPFVRGRVIDLSRGAARAIDMLGPGTARVEIKIVRSPKGALRALYAVQVGAFENRERAVALCEELRAVYPEATVHHDGVWHRVRIGDFAERAQAERLLREVEGRGISGLVVAVP